jgi:hypothetical protein
MKTQNRSEVERNNGYLLLSGDNVSFFLEMGDDDEFDFFVVFYQINVKLF